MALISLSFKKIYKPTNNNLRISSNTSRTNQDNSPRTNRNAGYENQRIGNVAGARENVGSSVMQKSGIQCYNCKEFRHVARECQKPKQEKDEAYHREKMLLCKQEEARIQLNAEQADWRDDTDDDELEDQELKAHYMYMAQLQEVSPDAADSGPIFDDEPVQKLVEIVLFIIDSGCSKHMTRNLKLLINFVEKFLGTVTFGNDQIVPIFGYGDLVQGAVTIKNVYYVEGLNHNLFSVGQFCDADLEVAFRKSTSKDETPKVLIDFLRLVQRGLQAQVRVVRTDKGTEFLNQTLHAYFAAEGILHQTSVGRTSEQNGVVKRRNRTFVEAARTMLSAAKVPLFFWADVARTPKQNDVVERRNHTLVEAARIMLSAAKVPLFF
nr:integrase, catalytic region, zinc finger, CCHC-type, peptidase aspartic, catalytic [Tanacetum cinerariifolium]